MRWNFLWKLASAVCFALAALAAFAVVVDGPWLGWALLGTACYVASLIPAPGA